MTERSPFRYFKASPECIRLAAMLNIRFPLSLRNVEKSTKQHEQTKNIITDHPRSYGAALKDLVRGNDRELGRRLNNRAENSHLPFRRWERAMWRFRRMRTLQTFAFVHASVLNRFPKERHLLNRDHYKQSRAAALAEWRGLLAA